MTLIMARRVPSLRGIMSPHEAAQGSTTGGIPVAPGLGPAIESAKRSIDLAAAWRA
jgi:hypothetical protein